MSDKINKKRGRGANYTPEEKTLLIDLIMQYKHIVEDKSTGGQMINKKKEAWREITLKYNSNCSTGSRHTEQLKALYDNMKQKSRKHVGESNKMQYILSQKLQAQTSEIELDVNENDIVKALKHVKEDKVQMHKTSGGVFKPKTTDSDAKILGIIQDQVEPLTNPFDSGAVYFKDCINIPEIVKISTAPSSTLINNNHTQDIEINITDQKNTNLLNLLTTPSRVVTRRKIMTKNVSTGQKKIKKGCSSEALKRIYFKKKCENAYLERRKIMKEILNAKQEHNLKMLILKKKLDNLNKC